jgi:hypothetical protein
MFAPARGDSFYRFIVCFLSFIYPKLPSAIRAGLV